jgi:hypothetical protein
LAAEKIEAVKIGLATAAARLGALEGFNAFEQKAQFQI